MQKILELRRKRAELVKKARDLLDLAESEKRSLSGEEAGSYTQIMDDVDKLNADIVREERLSALEAEMNQTMGNEPNKPDPGNSGSPDPEKETREAFVRFIKGGVHALTPNERRALQAGSDVQGGYLVPPMQFITTLLKKVDDQVFVRPLATVQQLTQGDSLGMSTLENDPADCDWTTELGTGSEDSTMDFGKRELAPHPLAKRIRVSNTLIQRSALPIEDIVRDRLAYKLGITQEKAYLTGIGANQPLGVFTASANGISTGRDVSDGNSATAIAFDGIINAKYSVKAQYWPRAVWIFHRTAVREIAKLKDGDGQYIWRESVRVGEPDRLLGNPVNMSEYCPNTFTTGLYVGIFGDFAQYSIVDALNMSLQRLVELYAESNQTGFILRYEGDGMPVMEEAFARVKLL